MTLQSEDMGKLVAVMDLSRFPGGPTVFNVGDTVSEVDAFGVNGRIVAVRHDDGRYGVWARSCFRPAHSEAQPESDGGDREIIATAVFDCPEIRGEFNMTTARKVADYILAALASKGA